MAKQTKPGKLRRNRRLFLRSFMAALLLGGIAIVGLVLLVSLSPGTGTQGADFLRNILGPQPVADMEAVVFTVQDTVHHILFTLQGGKPAAPWQVATPTSSGIIAQAPATATLTPIASTQSILVDKNASNAPDNATPTASPPLVPEPAAPPAPPAWQPAPVTPLGQVPGEGIWQAWIQDASGNTVGYRTYLAPDPGRPYAIVAVVAMDLTKTQLHYQLGTEEPVSPGRDPGTGQIPNDYLQPGILLAAFNGAFKTIHGHYGVMVDGKTLVPLIDGLGTLVIYKDGSLRIGQWNVDLTYTPDMLVVRQNCPLMIIQGEINPQVYNDSVSLWGGTIKGDTVTFRSGIGLSQDGKTLYYFAGNYLSMQALARAMQAAGAYQAMQLDINNYYVIFTRFDVQNGKLTAIALLPDGMVDNVGRFLGSYSRDYFYLTGRKQQSASTFQPSPINR